ncbi:hypothetical protein D3C81_2135400 [compost metagenome]
MIARGQRLHEYLGFEVDHVVCLAPLHRSTEGLLVSRGAGRSRVRQAHAQDRVLPQPARQHLAAQHAADADEDVVSHRGGGAQAAAVQ